MIYYKWKSYLEPSVKLYPLELKGRGRKYDQLFYENMNVAIEEVYHYDIYGHRMESLLTYELYYKIEEIGRRQPKHILFSGYGAHSIIKQREITYTLPDHDYEKDNIVRRYTRRNN